MIYELKKGKKKYKIDDLVLFNDQPQEMQDILIQLRNGDNAEFDNAIVIFQNIGRVLINYKNESNAI